MPIGTILAIRKNLPLLCGSGAVEVRLYAALHPVIDHVSHEVQNGVGKLSAVWPFLRNDAIIERRQFRLLRQPVQESHLRDNGIMVDGTRPVSTRILRAIGIRIDRVAGVQPPRDLRLIYRLVVTLKGLYSIDDHIQIVLVILEEPYEAV